MKRKRNASAGTGSRGLTVLRVPLDRGGYTKWGQYFGVGEKLWEISHDDIVAYARGATKRDALEFALKHIPKEQKYDDMLEAIAHAATRSAAPGATRNVSRRSAPKGTAGRRRNEAPRDVELLLERIRKQKASMKARGARSFPPMPKSNDAADLAQYLYNLSYLDAKYLKNQSRNPPSALGRLQAAKPSARSVTRFMNPRNKCWGD